MQYKIITNTISYSLAVEVEKYLKEGWKLSGGVSTHCEGRYTTVYCQALFKE
jgi:hypothetical protein